MLTNDLSHNVEPLTQALMKLVLGGHVSAALDAGGEWAIEFPAKQCFTLSVVQKGECWLSVDGTKDGKKDRKKDRKKIRVRTGDCLLFTGSKGYSLSKSLPAKRKVHAYDLFSKAKNGVTVCNGGGDFFSIGTVFEFKGHLTPILFGSLPPVIHVPSDSDQAAVLRWSTERFGAEFRGQNIGKPMMLSHLALIMLLQTIRIYLNSAKSKEDDNWLVALSDPKLSKAIEAMHSNYKNNWSLESLARTAGMSRSGFAQTFKKKIGVAPMDYLTNWRMQIACELLRSGGGGLLSIANSIGYGSESAFSVAFKKILKCRPGFYQKNFESLREPILGRL
jgi:AraC-like DNA-binding protein